MQRERTFLFLMDFRVGFMLMVELQLAGWKGIPDMRMEWWWWWWTVQS